MLNSGFNGKFDRAMRPIRERAKQEWQIGDRVNVGFLKGLEVMAKNGNESTLRSAKGALYSFIPHQGICRI